MTLYERNIHSKNSHHASFQSMEAQMAEIVTGNYLILFKDHKAEMTKASFFSGTSKSPLPNGVGSRLLSQLPVS
jgi:hypothetical protein